MTSLGRTQIGGVRRGWVVRELLTNDPPPSNSPYLCPAQTGDLYCNCKDSYCVKILIGQTVHCTNQQKTNYQISYKDFSGFSFIFILVTQDKNQCQISPNLQRFVHTKHTKARELGSREDGQRGNRPLNFGEI